MVRTRSGKTVKDKIFHFQLPKIVYKCSKENIECLPTKNRRDYKKGLNA
jgi:hypothetical protein